MQTTRNLKGKLARELDAIRARIRRQDMTAKELRLAHSDLSNLAARAYKAELRADRHGAVLAFINAAGIAKAVVDTAREVVSRLDALQAATL